MIDLYTWTTPNGRKVSILLEELGIEYNVHSIDITKNEQFNPSFLAIAPNNRIPAIVDHDAGISMMESGAIMQYLADRPNPPFCQIQRRNIPIRRGSISERNKKALRCA